MARKRNWIMGFFVAVLLTLSTGTHDGTTFSCTGSGNCVGDVCD